MEDDHFARPDVLLSLSACHLCAGLEKDVSGDKKYTHYITWLWSERRKDAFDSYDTSEKDATRVCEI